MEEAPYRDDRNGMVGVAVTRDGSEPAAAGCVVISGSGGGQETSLLLARAFATAGIDALGLAYHGAEGLRPSLRQVPLEGFARASYWLQERTGLSDYEIALVGLSRGSEAAMLTAASFDNVCGRVVGVVPGNVVACSWPPGGPAWLLDGAPVPFVDRAGPDCADPEALIPVERIVDLLLVSAGQDEIWPSGPMSEAMVARRASHGLGTEHVHLPEAGHLCLDPGDREDSSPWKRVVRFVSEFAR